MKSDDNASLRRVFADIRRIRIERDNAAATGCKALAGLAALCAVHGTTDQTARLRRFLYSAYSGAVDVSLNDVMSLDWDLRLSLLAVLRGLGGSALPDNAIRNAFAEVGLLDWFMVARPPQPTP